MNSVRPLPDHLMVVHYHLRPGGVRRVIELALPALVRSGGLRRVTMVVGEHKDEAWSRALAAQLGGVPLEIVVVPAFRYASEQRSFAPALRAKLRSALDRLAETEPSVIWAHNLGLGRNVLLAEALAEVSGRRRIPLLSHHHDFWFENRWARWPEMRRAGLRQMDAVAERLFAAGAEASHATINQLDQKPLARRLKGRAPWLPNLASRRVVASPRRVAQARRWLADRLGDNAPVWVFPARFLRRKNLGEAVLLTRWLRPEGWLVTTAGLSSPDEAIYGGRLEQAARQGGWRARFRLLSGEKDAPGISDIMAAAEAVLLTSAQEGFGLPYLEAVAAGRPLLARRLPNVLPDLESLGFRFPHLYDEIWMDSSLLDLKAERSRQRRAWAAWKAGLPASCRELAGRPLILTQPADAPVPFSRLTLSGQLEILALDPKLSWLACAALNPRLATWQRMAEKGALQLAPWPAAASAAVSEAAYCQRFWEAVRTIPRRPVSAAACRRVHQDFLRQRLGPDYLYPLLFPQS